MHSCGAISCLRLENEAARGGADGDGRNNLSDSDCNASEVNENGAADENDIDVDGRMQRDHHSLHHEQQLQQYHQQQQHQLLIQSKSKAGSGISGGCGDHKLRQKRFTQQRSILKNSTERSSNQDEQDLLEAKKQLILRRRRLFSHYRQYEQWRRRQFSYDPCYYRAIPVPIGQALYTNYAGGYSSQGQGAFRRRRQYRRQYSCAEREDSRESRESSSLRRYKGESMMASESFNTDSVNYINYEQQQEPSHQRSHQSQQQHHQREESVQPYSSMGRRSVSGIFKLFLKHNEVTLALDTHTTASKESTLFIRWPSASCTLYNYCLLLALFSCTL